MFCYKYNNNFPTAKTIYLNQILFAAIFSKFYFILLSIILAKN